MGASVAFGGRDISVLHDLRPARTLVYSFNSFAEAGLGDAMFGDGFLQAAGFAVVFIQASGNHWWQSPELDDALAAAADLGRGFKRRIGYGTSMGGFGALLAAQRLDAHVLAIAPQVRIDDPAIPLSPVWAEAIARRPILFPDARSGLRPITETTVLYDPRVPLDRTHAQALADNETVRSCVLPFAGHRLLATLKEVHILKTVIAGLLDGTIDTHVVRRQYRALRSTSARYAKHKGLALRRRAAARKQPG